MKSKLFFHIKATLENIGTEDDIKVFIEFRGDPSVGIRSTNYDIKIPNVFKEAANDRECNDWVEESRQDIYTLYSKLMPDEKCEITFDYESRLMREQDEKADREDKEYFENLNKKKHA